MRTCLFGSLLYLQCLGKFRTGSLVITKGTENPWMLSGMRSLIWGGGSYRPDVMMSNEYLLSRVSEYERMNAWMSE